MGEMELLKVVIWMWIAFVSVAVVGVGLWLFVRSQHEAEQELKHQILDAIGDRDMSGVEIREQLATSRKVSLARFYMAMSKLEDEGLVEGWYVPIEIDGHKINQRWYRRKAN